ncbi:MAG: hypothetical protein J3Q66DRAFT_421269 [Benniella sp.]|nr:MAG: hypothetical protein J3Q66DRAFT_421269 [Benniella sp.]
MRKLTESHVFHLFTFYLQHQPGHEEQPVQYSVTPPTDPSMSAIKVAEGYIKPKEIRQSESARKRASIRALGSITYLQKYYASGGTVCDELLDNDSKASFVDLLSPRAGLMPPSTEELMMNCHEDIHQVPDSPISVDENDEPRLLGHGKDVSLTSLNTRQQHHYDSMNVDMLALLESSTKAIATIRTYSMYAPGLTLEALAIHRQAALNVVEMLSVLEQECRVNVGDGDDKEISPFDEYCYASLTFGDLEAEREEMKKYLAIVQEQLFRSQAEAFETELHQLLVNDLATSFPEKTSLPKWIRDDHWGSNEDGTPSLDRCHDFLEFFRPSTKDPLPSPSSDKEGFLGALSDGYVMCMVFNTFIRLTNMPFGFVDKIHEDTFRRMGIPFPYGRWQEESRAKLCSDAECPCPDCVCGQKRLIRLGSAVQQWQQRFPVSMRSIHTSRSEDEGGSSFAIVDSEVHSTVNPLTVSPRSLEVNEQEQ